MIAFSGMLLAHLLYDFHWQGPFVADMKSKSVLILMVHAGTWALLLSAVLWWMGALSWWHLPFLFLTHALTDRWKSRLPKAPEYWNAIYIDQGIHLATIALVALS